MSYDNFITKEIKKDLDSGRCKEIITRFPPEPNGYLHLGHAKAICLNFEIAKMFGGSCNLRYDDTNPSKEDVRFELAILDDIRWLGYEPAYVSYASDYFGEMYDAAVELIKEGKAYVCDLPAHKMKEYRGRANETGKSPSREREIESSLELFEDMKEGKFNEGDLTLRAKIDMSSPNMNMRDPVLFRVAKAHLRRPEWVIMPSYDFAHPFCDAMENITHSLCTLEFENHRPLYDWVIENCFNKAKFPRQIEFAKLEMEDVVLSKRKLTELIEEHSKIALDPCNREDGWYRCDPPEGWSDTRLYTLCGMRERGFTPSSIKTFCEGIGISKYDAGKIDMHVLENAIRTELNKTSRRVMAVFDPIKVLIKDYPKDKEEYFWIENNPEANDGKRRVPFSKEIWIERSDFMIDPPKKFNRLKPGGEVRLKGAGIIKCEEWLEDENGVFSLICSFDREITRKVKGTIHWVSKKHADVVDVFEIGPLMEDGKLNEDSLLTNRIFIEPVRLAPNSRVQLMRKGYYHFKDDVLTSIVSLRSSYKGK